MELLQPQEPHTDFTPYTIVFTILYFQTIFKAMARRLYLQRAWSEVHILQVLMLGKSARGGIYYYATALEQALSRLGIQVSSDWPRLPQADLVHYHYDALFPLSRFKLLGFLVLARILGKPVVVTAHNPIARGTKSPLKYLFYWIANRIIVHDEMEWEFSPKTVVIPYGNSCFYLDFPTRLSRQELKKKWATGSKYVLLCYGTLRITKNYPLALGIVKALRESGIDADLVIAGNPTNASLKQCGLEDLPPYARLFAKYIAEPETNELFTLADAVLLTNSEHNHSAVPHIAYCFRKPVVASQCLAHQTRFSVGSIDECVSILTKILKSPPSMEEEHSRELVDFSWEKIARSTTGLYASLIGKK
ncbi:MAG: glycosyltransferase family 4 protein [Candidatus Diapherotrites archaeon]|uniref:Glycosyltransferase family 4 protein n=1 Tax=Candidatus Iainarchaeum sp. TaxID=3101447 RepID=A0A8T4LAT7_9ARCH|nr:glycosyltransferase family 4 protein [Candidatus Diapherotrites archaeon]